ncbi:MAG: hypothetical protein WCN95_16905, partial [bacterium]
AGLDRQLPHVAKSDFLSTGSEGWVKMQQTIKLGGEPINVHYVRNPLTGEIDDFKIVIQGPRPGS